MSKINPKLIDEVFEGVDIPTDEEAREETRKLKISNTTKGVGKSEDFGKKISSAKKGKKQSTEHRINNSNARKGSKLSEETRAKISEANKGRTVNEDTRAKISEANKGRKIKRSKESCIKLSNSQKQSYINGRIPAMKGKVQSQETRAKISEANKGRILNEETRAKISESKKGKSYGGNLKPIKTPYGIFNSRLEAGNKIKEFGITNAHKKIDQFVKNDPKNYYYISREEYIRLTGDNPFNKS